MTFSRLLLPATTFVAAQIVLALVLFSWSAGSP